MGPLTEKPFFGALSGLACIICLFLTTILPPLITCPESDGVAEWEWRTQRAIPNHSAVLM